jgi:hypothetical protein
MAGLLLADGRMRDDSIEPVLKAGAEAFKSVYFRPLRDGNGSMHGCLVLYVAVKGKLAPPGMVFPVCAVMQERDRSCRPGQAPGGRLCPANLEFESHRF